MFNSVRRIRWLVALLLLLFGQAGVASASVCPRALVATAAPELSLATAALTADADRPATAAERGSALLAAAPDAPLPSAPAPVPGAGGCSAAAALPAAPLAAAGAPTLRERVFLSGADTPRPQLLANSLFRPPRQP
jgi:hypothetical protein